MTDSFLGGTLRDMFCAYTQIIPDMILESVILVIDLPMISQSDNCQQNGSAEQLNHI